MSGNELRSSSKASPKVEAVSFVKCFFVHVTVDSEGRAALSAQHETPTVRVWYTRQ